MTGASDAENLLIDASCVYDGFFVFFTVSRDTGIGSHARGEIDVFWFDIDVIKEVLVHEIPIAFLVLTRKAGVFIEVEGDDIGE